MTNEQKIKSSQVKLKNKKLSHFDFSCLSYFHVSVILGVRSLGSEKIGGWPIMTCMC